MKEAFSRQELQELYSKINEVFNSQIIYWNKQKGKENSIELNALYEGLSQGWKLALPVANHFIIKLLESED